MLTLELNKQGTAKIFLAMMNYCMYYMHVYQEVKGKHRYVYTLQHLHKRVLC